MTVGTKTLAIYPGKGQRSYRLRTAHSEQLGNYRRRRNLHQDHMIQTYFVKGILKGNATLDLMSLNHRSQSLLHEQWRFAACHSDPREPVADSQDATQIVGGVPPFGSKPSVVEI